MDPNDDKLAADWAQRVASEGLSGEDIAEAIDTCEPDAAVLVAIHAKDLANYDDVGNNSILLFSVGVIGCTKDRKALILAHSSQGCPARSSVIAKSQHRIMHDAIAEVFQGNGDADDDEDEDFT